MVMTREEVYKQVEEVLIDALAVDDEDISEDATLTGDLGAESIDYLDIVFRLEKKFSIKIPKGELFPDEVLNNPDYVEGGKLTAAGMTRLKQALPHADFTDLDRDPSVAKVPELFTVKTLINYIESKLRAA